jgi:hypothetical protein
MNRKWMFGIAVSVLTAAALILVGVGAYRAGERNADDDIEVVGEVIGEGGSDGRTIIVDRDGWDRDGFFPGFFVFPLVVIGVVLLVASRRRRWYGGPGRYYGCDQGDGLDEWHRKAHAETAPAPPAPPSTES